MAAVAVERVVYRDPRFRFRDLARQRFGNAVRNADANSWIQLLLRHGSNANTSLPAATMIPMIASVWASINDCLCSEVALDPCLNRT